MRLVWTVIPLILIGSMIGIVGVQSADAIWGEHHPRELLQESETVFVGIIQSVNGIEHEQSTKQEFLENGTLKTLFENYTLELDEYTIKVEEFLKNPQESNTITLVQATVSAGMGVAPMKGFEIGDRVLFYVPSIQYDGLKQYSHESFKIPQLDCNPRPLVAKPCTSVIELKQMLAEEGITAPLKQIQSGIASENVICNENLVLILRNNNSPACVKPQTAEKLIERGWTINNIHVRTEFFKPEAELESNIPSYHLETDKKSYLVGEKLTIKGLFPNVDEMKILITNSKNVVVLSQTAIFDEYGKTGKVFEIPAKWDVGKYTVSAFQGNNVLVFTEFQIIE